MNDQINVVDISEESENSEHEGPSQLKKNRSSFTFKKRSLKLSNINVKILGRIVVSIIKSVEEV